jgi:putative tryptophan/tyrosine transport system substrate-binding protein
MQTQKSEIVNLLVALFAMLLPWPHLAEAQQPKKVPRIGYVAQRNTPTAATPDRAADAFQQGLLDLGYFDGKNIRIEYRYAEGNDERTRALVAELVQLKVDVLVTVPLPAIRAAKQATKTIPIVMVTTRDPVATGLIDSLARPGGNLTGVTRLTRELSGKRLELLKEVAPNISRVGVLGDVDSTNLKDYEPAAQALGIRLQSIDVQNVRPDFETALQNAVKQRVNALVTISGAFTLSYRKQIADIAIKNRLPSMHGRSEEIDAGGLMSYSAIDSESFRRAAVYVDKILKGAKPADLPVEQPTKFELVINLKTAEQIGLTIPQSVLYRADRVIK